MPLGYNYFNVFAVQSVWVSKATEITHLNWFY